MDINEDTLESKVFTDENISLDVSFEDLETSED
jgi:hypothetical protein